MRARRAAWTVAGATVGAVLLLGGCAGNGRSGGGAGDGAAPRGAAAVVDAADCAVRETVAAYGVGGGEGLPAASRAGAVPDGFVPVAAVECRLAALAPGSGQSRVPVPELRAPAPGDVGDAPVPPGGAVGGPAVPGPSQTEAPGTTSPGTRVDVVRLEGDLGPLLAQLRRPDEAPRPDQACAAMFQAVPVLYLVDADGRAVRAAWPTDACGFLRDGAGESVAALAEVDRQELTLP